jgi:alpha-D-xyloside xylohydrolase
LHGHRLPNTNDFNGAPNEVWSFGEEAYQIIKRYLFMRERLRPYIMEQMHRAHETGIPPMRPLFVDFPTDPVCYQLEDEYLFGSDLLVAPVVEAEARSRNVYLPGPSRWTNAWTGETLEGGQWITAEAPINRIPLFLRGDVQLPIREA